MVVEAAVAQSDRRPVRRPPEVVDPQRGPPECLDLMDVFVEIPMVGTGASLNVAVAGSLEAVISNAVRHLGTALHCRLSPAQ